ELVAEAERQRSDIIRQAREQADRDYGAERDRVRSEAALWEARRAELVSEIASLSAVIGRYHDGLRALEDRLDLTVETLGNERPPAVPRPPEPDEAPAYIDLTAARANDPDAEPPAGGSVTATF
ncbi:MAG: hypothetical protein GX868_16110, partial [Actinobacteria bacterium]|nr:hypothetical protein [Actinomycetota bacterium]